MRDKLDIFKMTPEDPSVSQLMELLELMVLHIEALENVGSKCHCGCARE